MSKLPSAETSLKRAKAELAKVTREKCEFKHMLALSQMEVGDLKERLQKAEARIDGLILALAALGPSPKETVRKMKEALEPAAT